MNLLYLKYAVEVAASGSINKAAEKLYIDQPNLSRSIRELEASLGTAIFERSTRGMKVTPDGEVFLKYADSILNQVEELEETFRNGGTKKKHFSISVPRASYISEAFARFSKKFSGAKELEMFYKETNSMRAIKNILEEDYKLGVVRYSENYDKYYKAMLEEKGLVYELIAEFRYMLLVSQNSPLAKKDSIGYGDLGGYIEIAHADPYVPSLPFSEVKKEELPDVNRRIFIFERGSQFDLLSLDPETFMWVSPLPERLLELHGLVQKPFSESQKTYKDVMIYRRDYKLSELDKAFISELCQVKREVFGGKNR